MNSQQHCSLERLVPETLQPGSFDSETLQLHLERYRFAAAHQRSGRTLDLACGVGYGAQILAHGNPQGLVIGVDLSAEAIDHAKAHYGATNLRFELGDAMEFSDADGFDTIVSLETVEHLPEPERFIERLTGMLRPSGLLIASVPTTPSADLNPHHLHDFTEASLRQIGRRYGLHEVAALRQVHSIRLRTAFGGRQGRLQDLRKGLLRYYVQHPGALGGRIWATLRHGFCNKYLTLAWTRDDRAES